jgi:N-acetylglutamate synthase-like GNAT family acetyltransferase
LFVIATGTKVTIRKFQPGDERDFRRLNEEWITRYFVLEPKDQESLADPQTKIIALGGEIYLAVKDGSIVGCCALVARGAGEFEVAKMAITQASQGEGLGRLLLAHVVEEARSSGVKRLYLETNHTLSPAIGLYRSLGFVDIPPERLVASPYARADVFMELVLWPS